MKLMMADLNVTCLVYDGSDECTIICGNVGKSLVIDHWHVQCTRLMHLA